MKKINIAIDGPAGAGKSTVAKIVAERLDYVYVDTGAMYRALTWKALQDQVDVHDEEALSALLDWIRIQLTPTEHGQKVFVNNDDVTEQIRERSVTNNVSFVAGHQKVRQEMVRIQQTMAKDKGVVMDGRDIGTHVLPDAEVKIYLSASLKERAKRRHAELKNRGEEASLDKVEQEIRLRDERDSGRTFAPLEKAADAIELNSTHLTVNEVVEKIVHLAKTCIYSEREVRP